MLSRLIHSYFSRNKKKAKICSELKFSKVPNLLIAVSKTRLDIADDISKIVYKAAGGRMNLPVNKKIISMRPWKPFLSTLEYSTTLEVYLAGAQHMSANDFFFAYFFLLW